MDRLTNLLNAYADIPWGTAADVHATLWPELDNVRNYDARQRENMMRDWKYKTDFDYAMAQHANGQKMFEKLNWEHSFALTILFAHYH